MLTSPLSANKVAGNIITMHYIHRRNIARNTVYIHWSHCCFFLYFFLSHIGSNAIWISCRNNQSRQARASNGATPSHSLTNARTPFTWPCFFLQVVYYANSPSVYAQPHFVCKIKRNTPKREVANTLLFWTGNLEATSWSSQDLRWQQTRRPWTCWPKS